MRRVAMLLLLSVFVLAVSGPADSQDRGDDELLDELEKILEAEKKKSNHDRDFVRRLERLVKKHRGSGQSGGDSGGNSEGDDGGGSGRGGRGGGGWGQQSTSALVTRLIGDIVLDDEQLAKVTRILTEFLESRTLIQANQHLDCYDDIKRDRNNRLAKAVGQRKAKEIIDSTDTQVNRWDQWARWGQRNGRGGGGGR